MKPPIAESSCPCNLEAGLAGPPPLAFITPRCVFFGALYLPFILLTFAFVDTDIVPYPPLVTVFPPPLPDACFCRLANAFFPGCLNLALAAALSIFLRVRWFVTTVLACFPGVRLFPCAIIVDLHVYELVLSMSYIFYSIQILHV